MVDIVSCLCQLVICTNELSFNFPCVNLVPASVCVISGKANRKVMRFESK